MNCQQLINKYFLIITSLLIVQTAARRKHHHHDYSPIPAITFDHLSNCYVESANLKGHCVRYQECSSAVENWQKYQKLPFTCYYTTYDNFICCPEAYIPPTSLPQPPPPPPPASYYPPISNPFLPIIPKNQIIQPQEERLSERECSQNYDDTSNHNHRRHRHHRSKRDLNVTDNASEPEESLDVVQEEIVEKSQLSQTEAVGGIQTHRNEFPFMCALGWRKSSSKRAETSYNCGCVLIARKFVLTAAHCATLGGESPSVVRLGGVDLDESHAEIIKIRSITQHPDYDSQLAYNDIAIVKLERGSRETPACLWSNEGLPQKTLTAIGYGQTKFAGPTSNNLLKVFLDVLTNENCNSYHGKKDKLKDGINSGQICAGDPKGKMDTCQGDSGGPMLMKVSKYNTNVPYIVGLTSFGEGCATGIPSVYSRVSHFIDWIEDIVWK